MAFSNGSARDQAMAEINIIPLCDVLLVLLIIFMVTAPALSYPIPMTLPGGIDGPPLRKPPPPVDLRIDSSGQAAWNGVPVSRAGLAAQLAEVAAAPVAEQPLVRIDASGDADYQSVARVLADANNAGVAKVGFLRK